MALTEGLDHAFLAEIFSVDTINEQARVGNITIDDAALAISIRPEHPTSEAVAEAVAVFASSTDAAINNYITGGVEYTGANLDGLIEDMTASLSSGFEGIDDVLSGLDSRILGYIRDEADVAAASVQGFRNAILAIPTTAVEDVQLIADEQGNKILSWLQTGWDFVFDTDQKQTRMILGSVEPVLTQIQETTELVVDQAQGFATALRETIPEIGTAIVSGMGAVGDAVTSGFKEAAAMIFDSFFGDISGDVVERIEPIIKMFEEELDVSPELRKITSPGILPLGAVGGLLAGLALPMIISSVGSTALSPFAEKLRQRMNSLVRPSLMSPNEVILALQREDISADLAQNILDRQGLPDDQADTLRKLVLQKPDIGTLLRWEARKIIDPESARTRAAQIGYLPDAYDDYSTEFYGPPPIGDLIRMVVRDVFDKTVVDEGGLRDDIHTFPFDIAKQIGLSQEWAERYWMAHWTLPSIGQGFEMLHRDQIDNEGLEALFKAADIAPGYKDKLKAIAYRPFTRVDVRRMNLFLPDFGEKQVLRSYQDIGYDLEKAQTLTDFTLSYNENTKKGSKAKERDLTKSDLIGAYNDGVLSQEKTSDYLESIGYSKAEVTVLIEREDTQAMMKERKADIQTIIDQARVKAIKLDVAQDRLAALDLTRNETNKALADLTRATEARTRTPSKSDLDDWLGMDLIDNAEYAEELEAMGYADKYVQLYVQATQAEEESDILAHEVREARRREPRAVSKGNLDSLFFAQIIDERGYTDGLVVLGYRKADINVLLELQVIRLEEMLLDEAERLARGEEAAARERIPSRSILGKLLIKGLINTDAYRDGLTLLGFSPDNVELLVKLIGAKILENAD